MEQNKLKKQKKFLVLGSNEYGEAIGINLFISRAGSIFVIFQRGRINRRIPLSVELIERYEFIKRVTNVKTTKKEHSLNCIINKRKSSYYRYYPVFLSYLNDQYILSIQLPDSTFRFVIHNIDELLSSLKEGMIFPGDKFIGLEAVKIYDKRKGRIWWKAKCLLCGREIKIPVNELKRQLSCGCLIGWNFNSDEERFYAKVDKQENIPKELQIRGTLGIEEEPCWLWTGGKDKDEYGLFKINKKNIRSTRYVLELKLGRKLLSEECALHRCDNPSCVNPNHLFEGTHKKNTQDMLLKNRANKAHGENHPMNKLAGEIVLFLRSLPEIKYGDVTQFAKKFNVSRNTINCVLKGKTHKHLLY